MQKFDELVAIIERLTAVNGCPWDRVQTHQSIRSNMIEEAYEAVDAIDKNDKEAMVEELGDMLLQVVLHADIAKRMGNFCIDDVIERLNRKLVERHTHIFGEKKAQNEQEALQNWDEQKAKEKSYTSLLDGLKRLPDCFPSLLRAQKIIKKTNFNIEAEELRSMVTEYSPARAGLLLFCTCALVTRAPSNCDAEVELNAFNQEFIRS